MPQIPIYIDNENYVKFLELDQDERDRIRKDAQDFIREEINKNKIVLGDD